MNERLTKTEWDALLYAAVALEVEDGVPKKRLAALDRAIRKIKTTMVDRK